MEVDASEDATLTSLFFHCQITLSDLPGIMQLSSSKAPKVKANDAQQLVAIKS